MATAKKAAPAKKAPAKKVVAKKSSVAPAARKASGGARAAKVAR